MKLLLANNAVSKLAGSVDMTQTSIAVTAGQGDRFPSPNTGNDEWFPLTLESISGGTVTREIVHCTERSADTLTVTRAQEGTTAQSFVSGDRAELRFTKEAHEWAYARANHTGTQPLSTISDAGTAAAKNTGTGAGDVPTTSEADARYAQLAGANDFTQMPTVGGAPIVESDSNSDGEWTRWADGAQICGLEIAASSSADVTWTFPVAFSVKCKRSATPTTQLTGNVSAFFRNDTATTSSNFAAYDSAGNRSAMTVNLKASGRWK